VRSVRTIAWGCATRAAIQVPPFRTPTYSTNTGLPGGIGLEAMEVAQCRGAPHETESARTWLCGSCGSTVTAHALPFQVCAIA